VGWLGLAGMLVSNTLAGADVGRDLQLSEHRDIVACKICKIPMWPEWMSKEAAYFSVGKRGTTWG